MNKTPLNSIFYLLIISFFSVTLFCCTKKLDIKPNQSMTVPQSIADYQAMLDYNTIMNSNYPMFGELGSDNYYLSDPIYSSRILREKNAYTWQKEIFVAGDFVNDWNGPFGVVYYADLVLDGLQKLESQSNSFEYANVKGSAFFYRAYAYFSLAQVFCKPYSAGAAGTDLGLPIRQHADINEKSVRNTLQQTYDFIVNDLKEAELLLPSTTTYKTRPSKAAVCAMLAKVFLIMGDYDQALVYSDKAISIYPALYDFNTNSSTALYPIPQLNEEILFYATLVISSTLSNANAIVDSSLFQSYNTNDLRKKIFFNISGGSPKFRGNYTGSSFLFGGIANDEIYLIRSECYARKGNTTSAMNDLNYLLSKRYKNGLFAPLQAANSNDALTIILTERRKELLFRAIRWADLKRLNQDPRYAITLKRYVGGQSYSLAPNDSRYAYPIPIDEINFSGMMQNDR